MTEVEIKQAENVARTHLDRIRTLEARLSPARAPRHTDSGIVPKLCELKARGARDR